MLLKHSINRFCVHVSANTDFIHGKQQKVKEILIKSVQDILTEQKSWTIELRCAEETISHTETPQKTPFFRIC